jgi:hypothetical protein
MGTTNARNSGWTTLGVALPLVALGLALAPALSRGSTAREETECPGQLRMIVHRERAYFHQHLKYTTRLDELGEVRAPQDRYVYLADPQGGVTLGLTGACPACDLTVACAGQLDEDPALDVWSVSTAARHGPDGRLIPPGQPFHDADDHVLWGPALSTYGDGK